LIDSLVAIFLSEQADKRKIEKIDAIMNFDIMYNEMQTYYRSTKAAGNKQQPNGHLQSLPYMNIENWVSIIECFQRSRVKKYSIINFQCSIFNRYFNLSAASFASVSDLSRP
jgi:hypothetical protein